MPRGTLGQKYHYSAAPLDAKIGLKINESDNWRHPGHYSTAPRLRTTGLESKIQINQSIQTRFFLSRLRQLIGSLKESVDQSGNLTSSGFDILSLINNLEYISDVVQCVAAKSE